ncbi:FAD-dependent oxidoreductase, partial [Mesorhizobium sp. M7A.F.Ca.AU.002.02.1.1]
MQLTEKDIVWRSHWLRQVLPEDPDLAPPLEEATQADICIVGGGYLGLWTAIRLKEHNPGFDVVILERDICGGGPSGRNSGMVLSAWTKYSALVALRDGTDALSIIKASEAAIGGIEAFCKVEAIDAWFDRIGWIWGATCEAQLGAWDDALNKLAAHGYVPARRVSRDEIAAMAGTTSHLGGAFDASSATVHPGFLVRGLRRAALKRGVRIYEKSPMKRFSRRGKLTVETAKGTVSCGKVVLAMNAWSGAIPELAPAIFNISSDDAMSQPIPDLLDKIGYRRAPLMIDSRVFVGGWSPTRDGRLSVGVSGGVIGFGGIVDQRFHGQSPRVAEMRRALRDGHPALADFPLETSWN